MENPPFFDYGKGRQQNHSPYTIYYGRKLSIFGLLKTVLLILPHTKNGSNSRIKRSTSVTNCINKKTYKYSEWDMLIIPQQLIYTHMYQKR